MSEFSSAPLGQAVTHAPHATQSLSANGPPPQARWASAPRPSTANTNWPWISSQARMQRRQRMQASASKWMNGCDVSGASRRLARP